jgi:hypothetical protein
VTSFVPSSGKGTRAYGSSAHPIEELAMPEMMIGAAASEFLSSECWERIAVICLRKALANSSGRDPGDCWDAAANVATPSAVATDARMAPLRASIRRTRNREVPQSTL